jgi:hypothetical protein
VALVIERVKLQDFIEDLTSLELTLAYIQMDFTRNSTINDVSAAAGLRGKNI